MKFKNSTNRIYKPGFKTKILSLILKGGLNTKLLYKLSLYNKELKYITEFRNKSLKYLKLMKNPDWILSESPDINYDELIYYSTPKDVNSTSELKTTFDNLGISTKGNLNLKTAIDIIFDSISVSNSVKIFLFKLGIIFLSLFEAFQKFPYLIIKYLNTVVPVSDNFYATLNSIVFSEGSFCYVPKDIHCEFNLTTYFRTNTENFAQFERTLLITDTYSSIFYLEGCTAPIYKETQLHVAIVEIILKTKSFVKYVTIQNWYKGNFLGEGGLYNFTTKRGICYTGASLEWLQLELGSAYTWKYPSTILKGNYSKSEFCSISFVSELQVADTGTKVFHLGSFSTSRIVSKSITLNNAINVYRGFVEIKKHAFGVFNKTECDSLIIGNTALTATLPYNKVCNFSSNVQQEAFISKVDENFIFFLMQRGVSCRKAITLIVNGFCIDIFNKIPLEIASEIPRLIYIKTESLFLNL